MSSIVLRLTLLNLLLLSSGCATMAAISTLDNQVCAVSFQEAMISILTSWEEEPEVAESLARSEYAYLSSVNLGARPFVVSSPSSDYAFFFAMDGDHCELNLMEKQSGFRSLSTNTWPWLASREPKECSCREY